MKNLALLLAFALIFASPMLGQKKGTPISLGNIWLTYDYYPAAPQGFKFMNDDRYYSAIEKGVGIVKYSVETGEKVETVVAIPGISSDFSYEFSGDEKAYFSKSNIEPIYRHSTRESVSASYLDGKNGAALAEGLLVSNATFCPTDNNKIAFVYENNVVLREVSPMKITQVTQGGNAGKIIHGMPDWVYEEEFGFADALKWSPSGKYLAFYTTDESRVKMWNMPLYPGENYTMSYDFKYPKAGEDNSIVSISIYNVETGKTVTADVGTETDQYIPRIKWNQDGSQLAVMRLNRLQNQLDVLMVDPETGSSQTILTEKSETYIAEATDDKWHFLKSGEGFLWLSEESGYKHIYHYDMSGKKIGAITSGEWEVEKLLGVDEDSETVYYTSTEVSPLERHLYKVKLNGKGKKQLTTEAGTHSITASPNMTYFMDTYSNTQTPPVSVLRNNKGKAIKELVNNQRVADKVARHGLREPEFFNFAYSPTYRGDAQEEVQLNGYMIKPADFNDSVEYPVLMFVYGGPGSQKVMNKWGHGDYFNYMWYQMLAQKGYIVACVDNRGTGGRGRDFRASTYGNLGRLETLDQIAAAKYLGALPYIDKKRIGIWGWSYGGYMTSLCLTKGNGAFKAGIAVAPVTNWRFYDTIYTERYLKKPQDNPRGYDQNSPINFADQLKGNLLLVHGTGDDNVHFQNTVEFINALIGYNKDFDMMIYPNRNHGIYGGNTRYHLYKKMTNFVLEKL